MSRMEIIGWLSKAVGTKVNIHQVHSKIDRIECNAFRRNIVSRNLYGF